MGPRIVEFGEHVIEEKHRILLSGLSEELGFRELPRKEDALELALRSVLLSVCVIDKDREIVAVRTGQGISKKDLPLSMAQEAIMESVRDPIEIRSINRCTVDERGAFPIRGKGSIDVGEVIPNLVQYTQSMGDDLPTDLSHLLIPWFDGRYKGMIGPARSIASFALPEQTVSLGNDSTLGL